MSKELVKDYIEKLKYLNGRSVKEAEYRPNLFYCPKLDEMVFMKKGVNERMKVSNIYLYMMEKHPKIANEKLSQMTEEERKDFILNNLQNYYVYPELAIGSMSNFIDKVDWSDENSDTINKLSILKVHQYFRQCGLAKELIKELRSATINNGYSCIIGRMSPLDNFDLTDSIYIKKSYDLSLINPSLTAKDSVDLHDLAQVYKHLGFIVPEDYILDKRIKMPLGKHSILDKDHYPDSYTDFKHHRTTEILVR